MYLVFEANHERKFKEMLARSYFVLQACTLFFRRFRKEWRIILLAFSA